MERNVHDIGKHHFYINGVILQNLSRDTLVTINRQEGNSTMADNYQGLVVSRNVGEMYTLSISVNEKSDTYNFLQDLFNQSRTKHLYFVEYKHTKTEGNDEQIQNAISKLYFDMTPDVVERQDATYMDFSFFFHGSDITIKDGKEYKL